MLVYLERSKNPRGYADGRATVAEFGGTGDLDLLPCRYPTPLESARARSSARASSTTHVLRDPEHALRDTRTHALVIASGDVPPAVAKPALARCVSAGRVGLDSPRDVRGGPPQMECGADRRGDGEAVRCRAG